LYAFMISPMHTTCHSQIILLDFIHPILIVYLVKGTKYEFPHYAVFSSHLLRLLSLVQIFSQYTILKHPFSSCETKFNTNREQQKEL
jgi:hypothetical protein